MEQFCDANSCADPMGVSTLADLFDQDRRVSFLEWLFTPRKLWNEVQAAKGAHVRFQEAANSLRNTSAVAHPCASPLQDDSQGLLLRLEASELRLSHAERRIQAWQEMGCNTTAALDRMDKTLEALCRWCESRGFDSSELAFPNAEPGSPAEMHPSWPSPSATAHSAGAAHDAAPSKEELVTRQDRGQTLGIAHNPTPSRVILAAPEQADSRAHLGWLCAHAALEHDLRKLFLEQDITNTRIQELLARTARLEGEHRARATEIKTMGDERRLGPIAPADVRACDEAQAACVDVADVALNEIGTSQPSFTGQDGVPPDNVLRVKSSVLDPGANGPPRFWCERDVKQ